ncbi:hypothetical protein SESBI_09691 [Sesbania bispinosa]|nr:hypothetical protein SESBI_09691 [Sesbania bispinosa]
MRSWRQEDSKANARVAEIFASHRNAWLGEEKWLLRRIDATEDEIVRLRATTAESKVRVEELEREVAERDEMIGFMSRRIEEEGLGGCQSRGHYSVVAGKKSREWSQTYITAQENLKGDSQSFLLWFEILQAFTRSQFETLHILF